MKKSEEKRKVVEELTELYKQLNVEQLYQLPDHRNSKAWLSEIAAILRNLDETDFQAFLNHRQHLYPSIPVDTRKHAAEQIDGFVRQKVAEYKRYDFSYLDEKKSDKNIGKLSSSLINDSQIKAFKIIKHTLDAIAELRELNPENSTVIHTTSSKLAYPDMTNGEFHILLRKLESKDIGKFEEADNGGAYGWGYNTLVINIQDWSKFTGYYREVESLLNIPQDPPKKLFKSTTSFCNYWNWINPFWLLWKLFTLIRRHKVISIVSVILFLLAIDYSLAWQNMQWIIEKIMLVFR